MKNTMRLLIISIIGFLLASCSSGGEETFRGSTWGDSIDDVIKREKKLGNTEYEMDVDYYELLGGEVTSLDYEDLYVADQKVYFMTYEFKKNLNGKDYNHPVLFEGTYYFDDNLLDEEKLLKDMESEYGKSKKGESAIGTPLLWWNVKDTYIIYFPDSKTLSYGHKSVNTLDLKDNDTGL